VFSIVYFAVQIAPIAQQARDMNECVAKRRAELIPIRDTWIDAHMQAMSECR